MFIRTNPDGTLNISIRNNGGTYIDADEESVVALTRGRIVSDRIVSDGLPLPRWAHDRYQLQRDLWDCLSDDCEEIGKPAKDTELIGFRYRIEKDQDVFDAQTVIVFYFAEWDEDEQRHIILDPELDPAWFAFEEAHR